MNEPTKTPFGEKTRTPGIYKITGKKGGVKYRLFVNIKKPDPQSASGWKWRLKGKTFDSELEAMTAKLKIQAAVRAGKYAELGAIERDPIPVVTMSLANMYGPCVYVLKEAGSEEILYVGMSINGIVRLNGSKHRGLAQARAHDNVIVQLHFCSDARAAAELESRLILKHRPKYNATVDLKYIVLGRKLKGELHP
jgi:hypothetical protein